MSSVGRWSLCIVLVTCLGGCSRNPEVRKRNYLNKGNLYLQEAKYQEAIIEYQNAIQIDPKFGDAHFGLAKVFLQQGDWNRAYQELSRAVEFDPANWTAQIALGNLMLTGGHKLEARHYAETVLQSKPNSVEAEVLLANSDAALNLLPKAIAEAQDAVRIDPKRSASYSFLAELQERNKDISSRGRKLQKSRFRGPEICFGTSYPWQILCASESAGRRPEGFSIRYCDKSSRPYSARHARRALPEPGPQGSGPAGIAGHQR